MKLPLASLLEAASSTGRSCIAKPRILDDFFYHVGKDQGGHVKLLTKAWTREYTTVNFTSH